MKQKDNNVLMIRFAKKWGHVYALPGDKFEEGTLEWIKIEDLVEIPQFHKNKKCNVLKYEIRKM